MRHAPITPDLFTQNRARLAKLLPPRAIVVLNANDILPTNADGTHPFFQNSDLFHLTGIKQEETLLVLFPDAADEKHRAMLFLRESNDEIARWEGKNTPSRPPAPPLESRKSTGSTLSQPSSGFS